MANTHHRLPALRGPQLLPPLVGWPVPMVGKRPLAPTLGHQLRMSKTALNWPLLQHHFLSSISGAPNWLGGPKLCCKPTEMVSGELA